MTVDFLQRVTAAGHKIVGVLDEHSAEDWTAAFEAAGLDLTELAIQKLPAISWRFWLFSSAVKVPICQPLLVGLAHSPM